MFSGCKSLTELDISNFDTSKVTDMSAMFNGCENLTSLDVSSFDTSNVTDKSYMFSRCTGLTSLTKLSADLTSDIYRGYDEATKTLYISNIETEEISNCTNKDSFTGETKWESNEDVSWKEFAAEIEKVIVQGKIVPLCLDNWFNGFTSLKKIEGLEKISTEDVADVSKMFGDCSNLKSIDLSNVDASKVTGIQELLDSCTSLTEIKTPVNLSEDVNLPEKLKFFDFLDSSFVYVDNLLTKLINLFNKKEKTA